MSFLTKYATHQQLALAPRTARPHSRAEAFVAAHTRSIEQLQAGISETPHTKATPNGSILVTLRNGVVPLPVGVGLSGKPRSVFIAANMAQAIDYLAEAIEAANAGEFEELFKLTDRKKRTSVSQ